MAGAYLYELDIHNEVCQHLGVRQLTTIADSSVPAAELSIAYGKVRDAELRRNVWRFAIRRNVLRPVTPGMALWAAPDWAAGTYGLGRIVANDGYYWQCQIPSTTVEPTADANQWTRYFGPDVAAPWDYTGDTTYFAGETVLVPAAWSSLTAYTVGALVRYTDGLYYVAITAGTNHIPSTATTYWMLYQDWATDSTLNVVPLTYPTGYKIWVSIQSNNIQDPISTSGQWVDLLATAAAYVVLYPIGTGPVTDPQTRNIYRLPLGFLRKAPTEPKADAPNWLGSNFGRPQEDWVLEGNYLVTFQGGPLLLRYVADVVSVLGMDPMFCAAIAARLAYNLCERITSSSEKRKECLVAYKMYMGDARLANAISNGSIALPEDPYLTVRL